MPVINGVYLKDFTALPGAVADADIIPIAITGNQIAYRTTVSGIVTDARITAKLLTGLSVTGGAVVAADTILAAFGKVQNQINGKQGTITLTTTGTSGAATLVSDTLNIPQYADAYVGTVTSVGLSSATSGVTIGSTPVTTSGTITIAIATATSLLNGLLSSTDWTTFNNKQGTITLTTTGTSGAATFSANTLNIPNYADSFVGTVTSVAALTLGTTGSDLSSTVANGTTTPVITLQVPTASAANRGALSSADWSTFNGKQGTITLTTTGTSGAATFSANTLNIPNYADGGVLSLSAIGATANANAATITGTVLNLQPADASFGGVVTTGVQTFAGAKTFTGALAGTSATFSDTLTVSGSAISYLTLNSTNANGGQINIQRSGSTKGYLGSAAQLLVGGVNDIELRSNTNLFLTATTDMRFYSRDVLALTLGASQAATFSSTATATSFIPSGATVPTNGMYLSAANTLDFATNTTNRLSIASTGAATFSGNLSCSGVFIQLNQTEIFPSAGASNRAYAFNLGNVAAGDFSISQGSTATGGTYTTRLIINPTGAATFSSSVTATSFFESSSIKGKDIIKTNPLTNLNLDVIQYTRKTDESKDVRYGYSAEQIHSLMPELTDKDITAVKYLDVHTILIAQLQQEIRELKAKLN